eukprot:6551240-Karenia_brevis.AAC.1
MRVEGMLSDGTSPDAAISACWQHMAPLLDEIDGRGLLPDVISFSGAILPSCVNDEQQQRAAI